MKTATPTRTVSDGLFIAEKFYIFSTVVVICKDTT